MNCNEIRNLLSAYSDGELTAAEEKEVKAHLDGCADCQKQLARLSVLHKALRTMEAPPVPEGLCDRVLAAATAPPAKKGKVISLSRVFSSWQTYSLAAACMLIFTMFYSRTPDHFSIAQKTNLYIAEERPISIPANLPTMPLGPDTPMASPVPSASPAVSAALRQNRQTVLTQTPENQTFTAGTQVTADFAEEAQVAAPAAARSIFEFPAFSDAQDTAAKTEVAKTEPAPEKTTAPVQRASGGSNAKTPAPTKKPAAKTYPTVGSLVKRSITFVVDDLAADAVFQSAKGGGVSAVRNAFYANGISFSTRESVIEEYAGQYNALANEANSLAQKIADGNTSLSAQLSAKEREMQDLKNLCASPALRIAYQ